MRIRGPPCGMPYSSYATVTIEESNTCVYPSLQVPLCISFELSLVSHVATMLAPNLSRHHSRHRSRYTSTLAH